MRWHNGAKSAFALGFDMDGDTIWRNKTRCLPNGDSYIKGPSIGQYGTKKGALRVLEILEEFSLKSTWFIPANIVMEHPDVVEKILDLGHEIGHHGLDHTGEYGATFEEQRERIELPGDFLKIYRAQGGGLSAHGRAASGDGAVDLLGGRFCVLQRRNQRRGMQLVRGGGGAHPCGEHSMPG